MLGLDNTAPGSGFFCSHGSLTGCSLSMMGIIQFCCAYAAHPYRACHNNAGPQPPHNRLRDIYRGMGIAGAWIIGWLYHKYNIPPYAPPTPYYACIHLMRILLLSICCQTAFTTCLSDAPHHPLTTTTPPPSPSPHEPPAHLAAALQDSMCNVHQMYLSSLSTLQAHTCVLQRQVAHSAAHASALHPQVTHTDAHSQPTGSPQPPGFPKAADQEVKAEAKPC